MPDLDINLRDPAVQKLMRGDESRVVTGNGKRPMEQLAGDPMPTTGVGADGRSVHLNPHARDPLAARRGNEGKIGAMSTTRLDSNKLEVLVAYRGRAGDFDLTIDVYRMVGEPIELHLICPKCRNKSRITGDKKRIEFDERSDRSYTFVDGTRFVTNGGRLDVETFECSWELDNKARHVQGLVAGGVNLCRMRLAIENSIAKDA